MSMQKIYTCDICGNEKPETDVKGFWFETNESEPNFVSPTATDNIHICHKCRNQLSRALTKEALEYTN